MRIFKDITEWEVLTPDGWCNFNGIVEYEKKVITFELENGDYLTGSETHKVITVNGKQKIDELEINNEIETFDGRSKIIKISALKEEQKVYDLVEVDGHMYYTNGILSCNCDEIAFIPSRIQSEFMAGTSPALSATNGKMLLTSTPNGSRDLFAQLWLGTGMEWDKKKFTYTRKNAVKNAYEPLFVPFWIDSTKNTDEWIAREKRSLGDPLKWKVEFECLGSETEIEVYDVVDKIHKIMTIADVYKTLFLDNMSNQLIINDH